MTESTTFFLKESFEYTKKVLFFEKKVLLKKEKYYFDTKVLEMERK